MSEIRKGVFRNKEITYDGNVKIMGIINMTPDSFSDGGDIKNIDDCLYKVEEMINDGADIIDVGGESTRPSFIKISDEEEIDRVCVAISKIKQNFDTIISVDTYKYNVALEALKSGAHIINDISGLNESPSILNLIKEYGAGIVLMFNKRYVAPSSGTNILDAFSLYIDETMRLLGKNNINDNQIVFDPGIGFGTLREEDMLLFRHMREIIGAKFPVLLGVSRKRMIGDLLMKDTAPQERDYGSVGAHIAGKLYGADILRVHNVRATSEALKVFEKIYDEV